MHIAKPCGALVHCRVGSLENEALLRIAHKLRSLPSRQLRKEKLAESRDEIRSLPSRQLRNCASTLSGLFSCSLPSRQLRKGTALALSAA